MGARGGSGETEREGDSERTPAVERENKPCRSEAIEIEIKIEMEAKSQPCTTPLAFHFGVSLSVLQVEQESNPSLLFNFLTNIRPINMPHF